MSNLTIDSVGDIATPGSLVAGQGGTNAGAVDLTAGPDPGPSSTPNTFSLVGPAMIPTSYEWKVPSAQGQGYLYNDGSGNLSYQTPSGGTGGGGSTYSGYGTEFPVTDPTTVSFSWRNQGGATETVRTKALYLAAPPDGSSNTIRGREVAAQTPPFSVTIGIIPHITFNYNSCGLYVTDGTKVICLQVSTPANGGGMQLASFNSFNEGGGSGSQLLATNVQAPGLWYLKVLDDGTNLQWFWSVDGQDFIKIYAASRIAILSTVSAVGYFASAHHSTVPDGVLLVSWATGTS